MKEQKRIAFAMILGDPTPSGQKDWKRCVKSIEPYIDGLYVCYNGGSEKFPYKYKPKVNKFFVKNFEWEENFAIARNQSFGMIPLEEYDWIGWIDCDDTLVDGQNLQSLLNDLDSKTQVVMLRYDYAVHSKKSFSKDNKDTALCVQWRERLFRADVSHVWENPIHEVCAFPIATQMARKSEVGIKHNREATTGAKIRNDGTRERNRRILVKAMKEDPENPRYKFYYANEIYAEAALASIGEHKSGENTTNIIDAAIEAYNDFLQSAKNPEDVYQAHHQIAELYRLKSSYIPAIESELRAAMILESWPDAYIGIAQCYMHLGEWEKCRHWATIALEYASEPDTTHAVEPLNNIYIPNLLVAISYEEQGKYEKALEHYKIIKDFNLSDDIIPKIKSIEKILNKVNEVKEEEPISLRKEKFSSSAEKSIAFFNKPSFEPWSPKSIIDGGIGGTETAVCEIAKRFAADGWRVVVFGTPHEEYKNKQVDGIEWYSSDDYTPVEEYHTFVSVRTPEIFDSRLKAKNKFLWCHDVNVGSNFNGSFGNRIENIDKVIGVSDWHCNHMLRLYDIPENKLETIYNGVNLERFDKKVKRQRNRFIWSSSVDRGLDVLLSMWPEIKTKAPDAELHIFYGWEAIDEILKVYSNNFLSMFKQSIINTIESLGGEKGGVFWHGRVNQNELAVEMLKSDILAYPTYFLETNCCDENTLIDMPRDYSVYPEGVPIKNVKAGDLVWTLNEETDGFELKPVKWCKITKRDAECISVNWDDGTSLICTPEHKVLTYDKGWVEAQNLEIGESVRALKKHMMVQVGIGNYAHGKSWPREHRVIAEYLYGDIPKAKQELARTNHKVTSIEKVESRDVWDMEVQDNHNFVAGQVVIHNCIAVQEAQIAGVIPIVSDLAALRETIAPSAPKIKGFPNNITYRKEFMSALGAIIDDKGLKELHRERGKEFAQNRTWDKSYESWKALMSITHSSALL